MYEHPENFGTIVVIPSYLYDGDDGDPESEAALRADWGDEFVDILKVGHSWGCWAVNFDRDGQDYPDHFPTFDW